MKNKNQTLYFFIALFILLIIGFVGYRLGFLNFIYNVMIPAAFSQYNIVILSIIFGIAAFFSPCAFTILPAYVANYLGQKEKGKLGKALSLGVIAALGIITVNMVIGIIIALLGAATPFAKDPRQDIPIILGVRTLAGLFIVFLGVASLRGKGPGLHFIQRFFSKLNLPQNMYTYGILYNAAAIGCTGPILLALMLYAYASGNVLTALASFAIFSLTMGILMILITLITARFKQKLTQVAGFAPIIQKIAAVVMIIVGISIVLLTLEGNNIFVQLFFPYLK